ncbi:hypothetical protein GSI_00092 [Ganoderma sinense ZZ0214-1]|uniref:Uncharacterized protein n=1 Tax=Ganoderma sinense ZZ0214-1 TaxID=1077348 RepID=A0A2G8SRM8_9APHY|nr:hypothetical protein GSI_00092 [Ganoderma sinense ZZ0214-1]
MRASILSPLAAVVLAALAATVSAQSPPQFTAAFTGQFNVSAGYNTAGPFGTRRHHAMDGGTLSNATTGEVVADILSFSDNGIVTDSGLSFPALIIPLVWRADEHFASVSTSGVRNESGGTPYSWQYAHVETDSPTYSWMNGKFFIVQVDSVSSTVRNFTMYEETSSNMPASS